MRSKYFKFEIVKGDLCTYVYWPRSSDYYTKAFRTVVQHTESLFSIIDKEIGVFK